MSFLGKRFKRVKTENLDELLDAIDASQAFRQMLKNTSTVFSFTKNNDDVYTLKIQNADRTIVTDFRLNEEHEQTRRDNTKVKVTYSLDGDVLSQVIKQDDGKVLFFRREFGDREAKMIITLQGSDAKAILHYEAI